MANYIYTLGPLVWTADAAWRPQPGVVGWIDNRGWADQRLAGSYGDWPSVFCAIQTEAAIPDGHDVLGQGDLRELLVDSMMLDTWEAHFGYRPEGDTLLDLQWNQMLEGSDPTGEHPTAPLVPTISGNLEMHLGGHSLVRVEAFRWGTHPHTNRLRDRLRADFGEVFAASRGNDHARKVLGALAEKFRLTGNDWQELVPAQLRREVQGPLKPETTFTETFNQADSTTLGPNLAWTEIAGGMKTASQVCRNSGNGGTDEARSRAEADVSSADHYARYSLLNQANQTNRFGGVAARYAAGVDTCYLAAQYGNDSGSTGRMVPAKFVAGTLTDLGTGTTQAIVATKTIQCSGSTISVHQNGSQVESITDTSITGGTRGGIVMRGGSAQNECDNFEISDLATATITRQGILTGSRMGKSGIRISGTL